MYQPTVDDRYIYEEEGDVTEINFVLKGDWAIAFNTYMVLDDTTELKANAGSEMEIPPDMMEKGHWIAQQRKAFEYFGDYYVLASKRS